MAVTLRTWEREIATPKSSGTTLALTTAGSGTDYPQVGDLLVVAWGSDNAGAATPTLTSVVVTGAGSITTTGGLKASSTNSSGTAAAETQVGYAVYEVTGAFSAASVITLTFSNAIVAKVGIVTAFNPGVAGAHIADYTIVVADAPSAAAPTLSAIAPTGGYAIGCGVAEDVAVPNVSLTAIGSLATSGGGAASNIAVTLAYAFSGNSVTNGSAISAGWSMTIVGPPLLAQGPHFRFYADGTEGGAATLGANDTPISSDVTSGNTVMQLRVQLESTDATALPVTSDWQLQYARNGGTWTDVTTTSTAVKAFASANTTDGEATSPRLIPGTGSFWGGKVSEDGLADNLGWAAGDYTELVYPITLVAADLANGDTVTFRVLRNASTLGITYTATPSITIVKSTGGAKAPADTAAGSDLATIVADRPRTPADTAAGADSATPVQTFDRAPADTAAGSDAVGTPVQTFDRTPADTAAGADQADAVRPSVGIAVIGTATRTLFGASNALSYSSQAGNSLALAVLHQGGTVTSVFDSAGNVWTKDVDTLATNGAANEGRVDIWHCANATAITSVTATTATSSALELTVVEYSGGDNTTPVRAVNSSFIAGSSGTPGTPAATTVAAQAGDLVISTLGYFSSGAVRLDTIQSPYTNVPAGSITSTFQAVGYHIATGTEGAQWAFSGSAANRGTAVVAFRPAVTGANLTATPSDTAAGSDSETNVADFARTSADTAAGADSPAAVLVAVRTLADTAAGSDSLVVGALSADAFTEPFTSALPSDIYTSGTVAWDSVPTGVLKTAGSNNWYGRRYSRWHITGAFRYEMDFKIDDAGDVARDIYNVAFWTNSRTLNSYDVDGFVFRVQTQANDGGFFLLTDDALTPIGSPTNPALLPDVWHRLVLTVTAAGYAIANVYDRDTLALVKNTELDLASWLDALHKTSGVFGQKFDGAASPTGTRIDGITVDGVRLNQTLVQPDTAAGSDSATVLAARNAALADTAAGSDSATVVSADVRTLGDLAAGADSASVISDDVRTLGDLAGGTDSTALERGTARADTAAGLDSLSADRVATRTPADTAAGDDSAGVVRAVVQTLGDLAAGTDSASAVLTIGAQDLTATPADTAAGADSLAAVSDAVRTVADTAAGSDSRISLNDKQVGVTDTSQGLDAPALLAVRSRPVDDVAGGLDALGADRGKVGTLADTAAGADSLGGLNDKPVGITDTSQGLDTLDSLAERTRPVDDVAGGSDTATPERVIGVNRAETPADTASGLDSLAAVLDEVRAVPDTAAGTDAVSAILAAVRSPSDLAAGADAPSTLKAFDRSVGDAAGGSDAATVERFGVGSATIGDLAAGADSLTLVSSRTLPSADAAAGADSATASFDRARTLGDPAAGSDSASALLGDRVRTPADNAAGADSLTKVVSGAVPLADTAAGADVLTAGTDRTATLGDLAGGTDQASVVRAQERAQDDLAGGTDSWTREREITWFDGALGADSLTRVVSGSAPLADAAEGVDALNVQRAGATGQTVAENAQGQDDLTAIAARVRTVADAAGGSDALVKVQGSGLADSASGSDTAVVLGARVAVIGDIAAGVDNLAAQQGGASGTGFDDEANGTDLLAVSATRAQTISDLATGVDVAFYGWLRRGDLTDTAAGSDVVTRNRTGLIDISDSALGSDNAIASQYGQDVGVPVYGIEVVVRPYAGSVLVRSDQPVKATVKDERVLVKVGTDG